VGRYPHRRWLFDSLCAEGERKLRTASHSVHRLRSCTGRMLRRLDASASGRRARAGSVAASALGFGLGPRAAATVAEQRHPRTIRLAVSCTGSSIGQQGTSVSCIRTAEGRPSVAKGFGLSHMSGGRRVLRSRETSVVRTSRGCCSSNGSASGNRRFGGASSGAALGGVLRIHVCSRFGAGRHHRT
jgi:hypothetical protein